MELYLQVYFNNRFSKRCSNSCYMSIDVTDIPIHEPRPFSTEWFSYKINHAALRYEIGLSVSDAEILWANGGENTDLMFFRDCLKCLLGRDEKVITDNIYRDLDCGRKRLFIGEDSRVVKRILCRHEILNSRLKQFAVLRTPFRHKISNHSDCFCAVLNIRQLILHNESSLFDIWEHRLMIASDNFLQIKIWNQFGRRERPIMSFFVIDTVQ